jgi:hypothetical protein
MIIMGDAFSKAGISFVGGVLTISIEEILSFEKAIT